MRLPRHACLLTNLQNVTSLLMRMVFSALILLLTALPIASFAQSSDADATFARGKDFANSLNLGLPTTQAPMNFKSEFAPLTGASNLNSDIASGAQTRNGNAQIGACANYQATGDLMKDGQCNAVNWLSTTCMQNPNAPGCQNSYGASSNVRTHGVSGNAGTLTPNDKARFANSVTVAQDKANGTTTIDTSSPGLACDLATGPVAPATYELHDCQNNTENTEQTCNQELTTTVKTNRQAANTAYSCEGGTLSGQYCLANSQNPAPKIYACPAGFTLNGTQCQQTSSTPATPTYSCPTNQTLSGANCIDQNQVSTPATISGYSCTSGTLSGQSCVSTTTTPATIASYGCPAGQTLQGNQCIASNTSIQNAIATQTCTYGTLVGNQCITSSVVGAHTNYTCPTGFTSSGASCIKTESVDTSKSCYPFTITGPNGYTVSCPAAGQGSCSSGMRPDQGNGYCGLQVGLLYYQWAQFQSCPSGYTLVSNTCQRSVTQEATIGSYSCTAPAVLSGTSCVTTTSAAAQTVYSCNAGGTLSGQNCFYTTTTTTAATPNYTCPSGQTLSGNSCSITATAPATPTYSCPANQLLNGSNCISQTQVSSAATVSYSCQTGYTLSGSTCTQTTTQAASATYTCPQGSTLSGSGDQSICTTTTQTPATVNYSCADGSAPQNGTCLILSISSAWQNNCTTYESAAGYFLEKLQ